VETLYPKRRRHRGRSVTASYGPARFSLGRVSTDDLTTLEKVSSRFEAELMVGRLRNSGIEAMLLADDIGGQFPYLAQSRGVRVMVPAADEARAREILDSLPEDIDGEE
jgi:hypothetical protein